MMVLQFVERDAAFKALVRVVWDGVLAEIWGSNGFGDESLVLGLFILE